MALNNPLGLNSQQAGSAALVPLPQDSATAISALPGQTVAGISGTGSKLDITAATVVKATPGRLIRVSVLVAGSATGTVNDCATTGAAATANEVFVIPETVGVYTLEWPCLVGIVIVPGTGQTISVSYS